MTDPVIDPLVDIVIEDARWEQAELCALSEQAILAGFKSAQLDAQAFEVVVMGCDDARIAELNAEFREKPQATNVLSWPAQDLAPAQPGDVPRAPKVEHKGLPTSLGDIAISYETCAREAAERNLALSDHIRHLVLHGLLHLLGYDHETDEDATLMERLEIETLETLGIKSPY